MPPPNISFNTDAIPSEMRNRDQWVCWKYVMKDGKWTKPPFAPRGNPKPVSVTDPQNIAPFSVTVDQARKHGLGVGFVFYSGDGLTGIDLDTINTETQKICDLADSYTEKSPSGKGLHIIVRGRLDKAIKNDKIEAYSEDRFFTVTGDHIATSPAGVCVGHRVLNYLREEYGQNPITTVVAKAETAPEEVNTKGYTLQEIRDRDPKLDGLLDGGLARLPSPSEADMSTYRKLRFWGYTETEAVDLLRRHRYRKKLQRRDYLEGIVQKVEPITEQVPSKRSSVTQGGDQEPVVLSHLNKIEDPSLTGQPVVVEAVVSSTSVAYLAPTRVEATRVAEDGQRTTVQDSIGPRDPLNIRLVGVSSRTKQRILKGVLGVQKEYVRETGWRSVYKVRVRPPVFTLEKRGEKIVDEEGFEYKAFDIYITSDQPLTFRPSMLIRVEGIPLPTPRSQKTTFLAYKVEFPEEVEAFDIDKLQRLQRKFQGKTVKQRLKWVLDNFQDYSQIVGRRNLATAALLIYYTPTWVQLNGDVQKGWGNGLLLGDTTTAKSETLRKLIRLLGAGMLVTAETATTVGLTGTTTQAQGGSWFVDWGFLVLLDQKLLAVDGAHKLSLENWSALAEAERSGVVSIAKAAKDSAYARTRQVKIANAVDPDTGRYSTKSLANFLYPCQALNTILDKTSMARLDLVVFADQRDVEAEEINKQFNGNYDEDLELLGEVLKWCWSNLAEIEFTGKAVDTLLAEATNIYNAYFAEIIPIASIDFKWKLARLSVAMAYLTLSTEDFGTVEVTKEHVLAVVDFVKTEYSKAGLNTVAKETKFEKLCIEEVTAIINRVVEATDGGVSTMVAEDIFQFIVIQGRVTKDQLKTKFNLAEKNELRPLLAVLKNQKLIKRGNGFYPLPKLIEAYKLLAGGQQNLNGEN